MIRTVRACRKRSVSARGCLLWLLSVLFCVWSLECAQHSGRYSSSSSSTRSAPSWVLPQNFLQSSPSCSLVIIWLQSLVSLLANRCEILPTSLQGTLGNVWTYFSRSHFDSTPETRGYWPQWVEAGVAAKVLTLPYNVWDRPTTKNQSAAEVSSAMVGKPCPRLWIQKSGILFYSIIQLWCNAWSRAGTPTICWMGSCMNMLMWRTRHCQWTFCRHAYLKKAATNHGLWRWHVYQVFIRLKKTALIDLQERLCLMLDISAYLISNFTVASGQQGRPNPYRSCDAEPQRMIVTHCRSLPKKSPKKISNLFSFTLVFLGFPPCSHLKMARRDKTPSLPSHGLNR